jgi:hypothetical protein
LIQLRNFLEQKGYYRIILKRITSGHYTFKAKINNVSGVFILDTGASNSCIDFTYDSYFNLKKEDSKIKAAGAGALNMETALAKDNLLLIGKWELKKLDFILMDLSHVNEALKEVDELSVHGIIGADFLKQTRAIIDYGKNCFYII